MSTSRSRSSAPGRNARARNGAKPTDPATSSNTVSAAEPARASATRARLLSAITCVALLLVGAWAWIAPQRAYREMAEAARRGDRAAVAARIDFPRVAAGIKTQMSETLGRRHGNEGRELAMALASGSIDQLLAPDAITTMMIGGVGPDGIRTGIGAPDLETRRTGATRLEAGPPHTEGGVVFELGASGWRVVAVETPVPE